MRPEGDKEFEKNIRQLIHLIKKILTHPPGPGPFKELESAFKGQGINLNLCFFTFLPLTEEELDELEELYEHYLFEEDRDSAELNMDLNSADWDFLRRHGIRF